MAESRAQGRMAGTHGTLILGAAVMVIPFAWQLLTSLKTLTNATRVPPTIAPDWRWSNYAQVFELLPFGDQFLNTAVVAAARTAGQLLFCSMAAYAFARLRFPGRGLLFGLFLSVLMVPPALFVIPQYEIMADLGWLNSLGAIIAPGLFSAFGVFLLRQFFLGLPGSWTRRPASTGPGRCASTGPSCCRWPSPACWRSASSWCWRPGTTCSGR
ncbi:carbohydrate ABC transporter permease [Catellatospora bangladeshensis]|uniref:carbohydrate ABC transporter permease n=1 Tax=Catellatospora bangladeshensis TaxID=310355 RepID=UPI00361A98BD